MSANGNQTQARSSRPKPTYICRAKVGNGWTSIGAVWPLRSGEDGFSVKLNSLPIGFDGRFVCLPPRENGDGDGDDYADEPT